MIPFIAHMAWVNDDAPPVTVREAAASWDAEIPLTLWTRSQLVERYGRCSGPENVQANYYRVKILDEFGGLYVDADSLANPGAGAVLRAAFAGTDVVAATLPKSGE